MRDPKGTGDFELPAPDVETSEDLIARHGSVSVIAVPEQPSTGVTDHKPTGASPEPGGIWVKVPAAPVTPKGTALWHYTDAAGAIAIVRNGKLWASSVVALNDSTEYEHGRALAGEILAEVYRSRYVHPLQKRYIRQVVEVSEQVIAESGLFVLCASRAAHSLAQWRAYGGQTGHAIVLDSSAPLAIVADSTVSFSTRDIYHQWRDVLYEERGKIELIERVIGYLAHTAPASGKATDAEARSAASAYVAAIGHCKDESFSEEQESRYLVQAPSDRDLRFRATANGIVPYLEVTAASAGGQRARPAVGAMSLPIRRFVVGPFAARHESAQGATSLLRASGYGSVQVDVSTSTLR